MQSHPTGGFDQPNTERKLYREAEDAWREALSALGHTVPSSISTKSGACVVHRQALLNIAREAFVSRQSPVN